MKKAQNPSSQLRQAEAYRCFFSTARQDESLEKQKLEEQQLARRDAEEKAAKAAALKAIDAKQKALDAAAKANPTIENIAAKYNISTDSAKAAKAIADGMSIDDAWNKYFHTSRNQSDPGFRNLISLAEEFKTDTSSERMPTVDELAKSINVSKKTILSALKLNADPENWNDFMSKRENQIDDFGDEMKNQQAIWYIPQVADAIRIRLNKKVIWVSVKSVASSNATKEYWAKSVHEYSLDTHRY